MTQDKELARREKEFKQQTASASALLKEADAKSTELSKQADQVRPRRMCSACTSGAQASGRP